MYRTTSCRHWSLFFEKKSIVTIVNALLSEDHRLIAVVHAKGGVVSNPSVNRLQIEHPLCMNIYGDWHPNIQSQVKFGTCKYKEDRVQSDINSGCYATMQFFDRFILSWLVGPTIKVMGSDGIMIYGLD